MDPYWDAFVNRPPSDANNLVAHALGSLAEGSVNPTRTAVHSPDVMAAHIKELGRFFGASQVAIVELASDPFDGGELGFAVVCAVKSDHDTTVSRGIGGQAAVLKGLFLTFNLSAYIRELGYRATRSTTANAARLAALAGLLVGRNVHVADVIYTELPLAADGRETPA